MSEIIKPGVRPPFIMPYCAVCELPVKRMSSKVVTTWMHFDIEGECCGKTQGARITAEQLMRIKASGEKFFLTVRKGQLQGVKALAKR